MKLAIVAAGFTPGEADQLRRAMADWRRPGEIEQFQMRLIAGMKAKGLTAGFAETVFRQIRGFWRIRFPRKPRHIVCLNRLRFGVAKVPLSRSVLRRAIEQSADGPFMVQHNLCEMYKSME